MRDLLQMGERAGELLRARKERVAVAELSSGGLISAALLAVPGASNNAIPGRRDKRKASAAALAHAPHTSSRRKYWLVRHHGGGLFRELEPFGQLRLVGSVWWYRGAAFDVVRDAAARPAGAAAVEVLDASIFTSSARSADALWKSS